MVEDVSNLHHAESHLHEAEKSAMGQIDEIHGQEKRLREIQGLLLGSSRRSSVQRRNDLLSEMKVGRSDEGDDHRRLPPPKHYTAPDVNRRRSLQLD